jgi:hypothetical protein
MRSASLAEWLLSLVTTPGRASSIVGDLIEEVGARGALWFWSCVIRTFLSILWRSLLSAPISMVVFAVAGWFLYMFISLILWFFAGTVVTLGWGLFYFFSHHTGLELLINLLKLRLDWRPVPPELMHWVEAIVICGCAPLQMGRYTARAWPGREIGAWVFMLLLWPAMMSFVPFATTTIRVSFWVIPVIQASTLTGILRERRASTT